MKETARGKIKKAPAPEVVKYLIRPAILQDLERSYLTILDINRAHILMLAKQKIITEKTAAELLKATKKIADEKDAPTFEINPNIEDLYFNLEKYLISLTGLDIGGQQHTARSRNDLAATELRIDVRRYYLKLSEMFLHLRATLLEVAKKNKDAVMSGYTHMQPSEPITFAHYLSAVSNALARDYHRFQNVWDTLNLCPLGSCSMGSTSFPIDRAYTASLLGFDKPMENSIDGVAARDFALELVNALAMTANTMSRLALDLYTWSTPEYGYIEVDDSCAVCSSIMPQKKNPMTLEHVKGKAAHMEAFYVSIFSSMKNVLYSHCRDISVESVRLVWQALQEMEADFALLDVTVKTMQLKKTRMLSNARNNFCTVTELANYLVRYDKISFREAHEIIAHVVGHLCEGGQDASHITRAVINESATALFGFTTSLTDELINEALDPSRVAEAKSPIGGSALHEVERQLSVLDSQLAADSAELEARKKKVESAAHLLLEDEKPFLNVS